MKYNIIIDTFFVKKLNDKLKQYRKFEFQNKFYNINIFIFHFSQRIQRFKKFIENNEHVIFKRNQIVK